METTTAPENDQQGAAQRNQMNRSSFYMLLFLFSLLFFNFSDDSSVRNGKPTKADLLEELKQEKEILNNMTFGVNVTHVITIIIKKKDKVWSLMFYIKAFTNFSFDSIKKFKVYSRISYITLLS
ncbi:MAG: hypothetical protein JSY10_25600 [Paenibacillus sp.]|nr:hypothetical protein [Paenibacillus sp.]